MQQYSNGKIRRSEAEWREIFSRFEKSGLSTNAFCRQEGIIATSFTRWHQKLNPVSDTRQFIPVTTASQNAPSWSFVITLPNGCELRFQD